MTSSMLEILTVNSTADGQGKTAVLPCPSPVELTRPYHGDTFRNDMSQVFILNHDDDGG